MRILSHATSPLFWVAKPVSAFLALLSFTASGFGAPGRLDTSFNANGTVKTAIGLGDETGFAVMQQPDGKLVVAGKSHNGTDDDFALARYQSNGLLDGTFGSVGRVTTPIGSAEDVAYSLAIQGDGKIVAAGNSYNGVSYDFALVRYNANGTLDTSFNTTGKVTLDFGFEDLATAVIVQPDGKIVVVGSARPDDTSLTDPGDGGAGVSGVAKRRDFALARFNSDGSLDTSFGGTGKVTTRIGDLAAYGRAVALQPDGKIIVAGDFGASYTSSDFLLVRYNQNGSIDTSFNGTGMATAHFGGQDQCRSIAVQGDGNIVLAGSSAEVSGGIFSPYVFTNSEIALARFRPDGSLDTDFNSTGQISLALEPDTRAYGHSMALQGDGKILVAGYAEISGANVFLLTRFDEDGSPDISLNGTGAVTTAIGTGQDCFGYAMVLQADGKVVVAGATSSSTRDLALVRYSLAQPDVSLGRTLPALVGSEVYNLTGAGQTLQIFLRHSGETKTDYIEISNHGAVSDSFTIRGTPGNAKFRVKYFDESTNVTARIVGGTYTTGTLAPGESIVLTAKITALTPLIGKKINLFVEATSAGDGGGKDTGLITAKSR